MRDNTMGWEEIKVFSPLLKLPRQWPLVLLVKVPLREGKILESEEVKF
jgi:hypothetical protein